MSNSSSLSSDRSPRRQPKQKRGQDRVEKILLAAAEVFIEVGYTAATTQQIADRANTAIGSLYQFFPDKLAIFHKLEIEYFNVFNQELEFFYKDIFRPLESIIDDFIDRFARDLERPTFRCVFFQILQPEVPGLFSLINESPKSQLRQISIAQYSDMCQKRNPTLSQSKSELITIVAHNIYYSVFVTAFRSPPDRRPAFYAELKDALYCYLNPHIGDHLLSSHNNMVLCPHCQSNRVTKNGHHQDKQRYACRACNRRFIDSYTVRGYHPKIKQKCLDLHQQGMSFREIERQTGVSHNTVINWFKESDIDLSCS